MTHYVKASGLALGKEVMNAIKNMMIKKTISNA